MREILIILLLFSLPVFGQFNPKEVNDNIELAGKNATIDKAGNTFVVVIDNISYKASTLREALNMVYTTKIRTRDDYMFTDQKWGLLIRVTVNGDGWTVDMGGDEKYHADTFVKSKEIIYDLFAEMLKGGLIFNYNKHKSGVLSR